MKNIVINTTPKYTVDIIGGALDGIGAVVKSVLVCKKIMVITDSTVEKLYCQALTQELESAGYSVFRFVLQAGEESKTLDNYCKIINALAANGLTRKDGIIALGGGVVGDISGFAASTYMRGIDYIQIPTTLLACVDSSVGGKTAVDLPHGKNLVGAFYQPKKVIIRTELLNTLSEDNWQDGMGEVLKYAVLQGGELLKELSKEKLNLENIIALCVDIKRQYVESDERDTGVRQMLNLGHTFSHAYEHLNNFSVSHGKCVALGLRYALEISRRLGIYKCDDSIDKMLDAHKVAKMTTSLTELSSAMALDKKNFNGKINFVLIKDMGECVLYPMTINELLRLSDKIEISASSPSGDIKVINSKSYCHRAIIMASRATSNTTINGVPKSADVMATIGVIESLGGKVEWINQETIVVTPIKNTENKVVINVKESGSTMRFILPQLAALGVSAEVYAEGRLPERTNAPLIECLQDNGIIFEKGVQPIVLRGKLNGGNYRIRGDVSSQYISGLLMALSTIQSDSTIELTTELESADYVDITLEVMQMFGVNINKKDNMFYIKGGQTISAKGDINIEADWSNAAPWLVLGAARGGVTVKGLNANSKQGDRVILDILKDMGANINIENGDITLQKSVLKAVKVSAKHCPDLVPAIAVACSVADGESRICDVERLRIKESDRITAVIESLKAIGVAAKYDGDIVIQGGEIIGGKIDSHNDHRIAMLAAVAGSLSKGKVTLAGARAIAKSYPDFYEKLLSIGGNINAW